MTTNRRQKRRRQQAQVKIKKGAISFDGGGMHYGGHDSVEATDIVVDGEAVAFKDATTGKITVVPFHTIGMIQETE